MAEKEADAIVVLMTAASQDEASRIAEMLVGAQLAACVQILPEITSVYRWQGEIQREKEILLLAKTNRSRFDELEGKVRAMHSYETPEIIAVPVTDASGPYIEWLLTELRENP